MRARATIGFALTALLLAVALAALGYSVIRQQLVDEREGATMRQAYTNARIIGTGLRAAEVDVPRLLAGLQLDTGGVAFLHRGDQWFASEVDVDRRLLPDELRGVVADGRVAHQRVSIADEPVLVVGVPVATVGAQYFQVIPLADIDRTLSRLLSSLAVAGFLATALATAVGVATSGAVLRPLRRIAEVARRIVRGDLGSRLSGEGDPDLSVLTASFNGMLDELQARIDREARFASDVAHEVRGPLMALAAAVEVVNRRRAELPERAMVAVDALQEQVRSFNELVLDLLEISRFDAGAAQLQPEPTEVTSFVRHSLDEAGCAGVGVRSTTGAVTLLVDRRRLHQVLTNLVENAQRYAGGPTGVVVDVDGDVVRIAVEDRGPGVSEGERAAIFGRFARGRASERPGAPRGSGLGLALVSEHVELHGGRVWVEEAGQEGSRFVVELPAVRP